MLERGTGSLCQPPLLSDSWIITGSKYVKNIEHLLSKGQVKLMNFSHMKRRKIMKVFSL